MKSVIRVLCIISLSSTLSCFASDSSGQQAELKQQHAAAASAGQPSLAEQLLQRYTAMCSELELASKLMSKPEFRAKVEGDENFAQELTNLLDIIESKMPLAHKDLKQLCDTIRAQDKATIAKLTEQLAALKKEIATQNSAT